MANTYYDSQLTAEEIEEVLEAIDGVIVPANNGKVLAINNGKLEARSVQWGGGEAVLESLSVTENGDYTPEAGVDGFDEVHVSVPNSYSASDEGKVVSNGALVAQTERASQITQNGTYDTTLNDEVTVNVSGGGSAVVQPLSVTQNGTYNPPSGVDGYAPVTVNVSGGGSSDAEYWDLSDSFTGSLHGIISTESNVAIQSGGANFQSNSALRFSIGWNGMTIEIETGNLQQTSSSHRRFVMIGGLNTGVGFIYRNTGKWAFFNSSWVDSSETDGSFFDNCTVKIHIDSTGHWHIYKNNVLFWEPSLALDANYNFLVLGSTSGGIIGTIKSVKVY